jgi:hypothetical protein
MSNDTEDLVQDELTALKARADLLGISYHPSIGLEKLRAKVSAAINDEPAPAEEPAAPVAKAVAVAAPAVETPQQKRFRMKQEASRLVRIRVTCMNPAKTEWSGEIFTTGNKAVGSLKKFVPFNVEWHVPHMIYEMIRDRQCQIFHTITDARGNKIRRGKLIKEFNVEVLPDLTKAELDDLARRQAMAKSID